MPKDFQKWLKESKRIIGSNNPLGINDAGYPSAPDVEEGEDLPIQNAGDIIVGSIGTVVGYTDLLSGLSGAGGNGIVLSNSGGAGGWQAGWTNDTFSDGSGGVTWANNAWIKADLGEATRIGRFRMTTDQWGNNGPDTDLFLESSDDNSTWVTRWQMSIDGPAWSQNNVGTNFANVGGPKYRDTGLVTMDTSFNARYWRFRGTGGGSGNPWTIGGVSLYEAITEGSGQPEALPGPPTKRLLGFDPAVGYPSWLAPAAANPDTSGANLATVEAEVNELKALLRAHGLLSS